MKSKDVGEEFMYSTRYDFAVPSDQNRRMAPPPFHRRHPKAGTAIPLPAISTLPRLPLDLKELITRRSSCREYTDDPLRLEDLSCLLWCTQGIKEIDPRLSFSIRTVPSAGARHALETYLSVHRIEGLSTGLYQFLPLEHALAQIPTGDDFPKRLASACLDQMMVATCAVAFLWTAVPYRMTWRYGQRGYRYLHLDAGHVCQNLYLTCGALGFGCCAVAAFDDQAVADAIGIDGHQEFVIYLAPVGHIAK